MTIRVLYVIVSFLIGGAAVTYEIWHKPVMLDRSDGRGKFSSPKMRGGELVFLALFVILLWPLLGLVMIFSERNEKP